MRANPVLKTTSSEVNFISGPQSPTSDSPPTGFLLRGGEGLGSLDLCKWARAIIPQSNIKTVPIFHLFVTKKMSCVPCLMSLLLSTRNTYILYVHLPTLPNGIHCAPPTLMDRLPMILMLWMQLQLLWRACLLVHVLFPCRKTSRKQARTKRRKCFKCLGCHL